MTANGLIVGSDGTSRCPWPGDDPGYQEYHDIEWGRPVIEDRRLFEKLCLEGFQAGLSWLTILRKRESFRRAFDDFDFHRVALFEERKVGQLLADTGIVRHRGKIESTINNAQRTLELIDEYGSLAAYFWRFEPGRRARPKRLTLAALRALTKTAESTALSKDLKQRGFSFVGPTTAYAFMQAMGLVNDHLEGCFVRAEVSRLRGQLERERIFAGGKPRARAGGHNGRA